MAWLNLNPRRKSLEGSCQHPSRPISLPLLGSAYVPILVVGGGALLERPPDCGRHDSEKGETYNSLSDPTCDSASGDRSRGVDG